MRFKICFILLLSILTMWSQENKNTNLELIEVSADTVLFNKYSGKKSYTTKEIDTASVIKHGNFTFVTNLNEDDFSVNRLKISGNYEDGKKEGTWTFTEDDFSIFIGDFKLDREKKEGVLQSRVSGEQIEYFLNYADDTPVEKWEAVTHVLDSSLVNSITLSEIRFKNGIPYGEFLFKDPDNLTFEVRGVLSSEGFLDGEMLISYIENKNLYKETRNYYDGFLLDIKVLKNEELVDEIKFETTIEKINSIKSKKDVEFEFSSVGFGIYYDSGVNRSQKREVQEKANKVINKSIAKLNKFHAINNNDKDTLAFNFTRRFKLNYTSESQVKMKELIERNEEVFDSIARFVKSPSVQLNKDKSDELTKKYYTTKAYFGKLRIVDTILSLHKENYFDYINRDIFIGNVLDTINANKKIHYTYQEKQDSIQLDLNFALSDENKEPLDKLYILQDSLANASLANISSTYKEFKQFAQKETIDSLDQVIYQLNFERDSLFLSNKKTDGKFEDRRLSTNIFMAYSKNILNPIYQNYINTDDFENKMSIGKELVEFNKSIIKNKPKVDRFDKFVQHTDSLFTIYRDNPFDYRKSEVKIYPNINRKSKEVLFPHYVNSLLEAGKHKDFIKYLEKLYALDEKLLEFVKKNDEDVQRIDRAVRRENVPQRIERIYGLQ